MTCVNSLPPNARSWPFFSGERLGHGEVAIGAMRNHRLARLKTELGAIKLYRDQVRLERHQAGDAADLRIGLTIRPCRQTRLADVVIAAQPFVRAEGLMVFQGVSADSSMSARATYQRGAKPDS